MPRWITFDQQTFSLLRASLAPGTAIETFGRGALDYALAKPGAVVTLLRGAGEGDVELAVFRRRPRKVISQPAAPMAMASQPAPAKAATRAGGFLGLIDEPADMEEQSREKKGWWKKFWDE